MENLVHTRRSEFGVRGNVVINDALFLSLTNVSVDAAFIAIDAVERSPCHGIP